MNKSALDPVTLFSIYPKAIREKKQGLIPNVYSLEASDGEVPTVRHIEKITLHIEDAEGNDIYSIGNIPVIAGLIVKDFMEARIGVEETVRPGFWWMPGIKQPEDCFVKGSKEYKAYVKNFRAQTRYFAMIVERADDLWNQFKDNRLISDMDKIACNALEIEREWNVDHDRGIPDLEELTKRAIQKRTKKG